MNRNVTIYLGNFTDKKVLVEIGSETYLVDGGKCPYVFREAQEAPILVKIGFNADTPTTSNSKEFDLSIAGIIGFCEHNGELRFCEIEKLEPMPTLKLID